MVGISLPTFVIGILLILIFSVQLQGPPAFGRGDVVSIGWWTPAFSPTSGRTALIMPVHLPLLVPDHS